MEEKRRRARVRTQKNMMTMMLIGVTVLALMTVVFLSGHSLQAKITENKKKEETLTAQIEAEKSRTEEIEKLEEYMQSNEYIEDIARKKAGLLKNNEIIFREVD